MDLRGSSILIREGVLSGKLTVTECDLIGGVEDRPGCTMHATLADHSHGRRVVHVVTADPLARGAGPAASLAETVDVI